jgi:hypothetical protein
MCAAQMQRHRPTTLVNIPCHNTAAALLLYLVPLQHRQLLYPLLYSEDSNYTTTLQGLTTPSYQLNQSGYTVCMLRP